MRRVWIAVGACAGLAACAGAPSQPPHEVFDEQSGNTLSVVSRPLVFARSRTDVAAYARDYATLVAVELDRSGNAERFLLLHRWSTVDPRVSALPDPAAGALVLSGTGRVLKLAPLPDLPLGLQHRRDLHLPPHGDVISHAYRADADVLRFLATGGGDLTLELPQESYVAPFALWEDGRPELIEFLRRTGMSP